MAAGLLDEAVDLRQAEPRAVADILGRVERLEGMGLNLLGHARAGVGDGDHDVLARHDLGLCRGIGLVEIGVGGLDGELAAVRHGVARIDGEIEDADLELVGIGQHPPQPAGQHGLDGDLLAQSAAQQFGHAGDKAAGIDRLGVERLAAREGEQPLGERGRPLRAAHRVLHRAVQAVAVGRGRLQRALQGFQVADDDGQEIVEIVRHAAGELADALHLLRLGKLFLRPLQRLRRLRAARSRRA